MVEFLGIQQFVFTNDKVSKNYESFIELIPYVVKNDVKVFIAQLVNRFVTGPDFLIVVSVECILSQLYP